jgi:hypothetical protein
VNEQHDPHERETAISDPSLVMVQAVGAMIVSRDLADFGTPGVWVEVDPETAEQMGAFEETALSLEDADDDGHDD